MLMINGVELIVFHEAHQMGEFHGNDAPRLEQDFHTGDKVIDVWDVSEHVVSEQQIGGLAGSSELTSRGAAKKFDQGGNSFLNRNGSDVCGDVGCREPPILFPHNYTR